MPEWNCTVQFAGRYAALPLAVFVFISSGSRPLSAESPAPSHPKVQATASPPRYRFRTWNTEQGLPQNSVECITQTADGYLWLGTRAGLVRFDGVKFTP